MAPAPDLRFIGACDLASHVNPGSKVLARVAASDFDAVVIEDACRAIDNAGSLAEANKSMTKAGVKRANSASLLAARG